MVIADHRNLDKEMETRAESFVETSQELKAPFADDEVKTLQQSWGEVKYITARMVMDRLDEALTPVGWTDRYVEMSDGSVQCSLSLYFLGWGWLTRCDVGSPQGSEPMKAAYSDALKRAAVKFGIGRYLYADTPSSATSVVNRRNRFHICSDRPRHNQNQKTGHLNHHRWNRNLAIFHCVRITISRCAE